MPDFFGVLQASDTERLVIEEPVREGQPFTPEVLHDLVRILKTYGAGVAWAHLIRHGVPLADLGARLRDVQAVADFENYDATPASEVIIEDEQDVPEAAAALVRQLRTIIRLFFVHTTEGYLPSSWLTFGEDTPIHELHALRQQILAKLYPQTRKVTS
jgi:hypothetical protein